MSLNSLDRNYGNVVNPREFWGGNNGWVTVAIKLPADVEVGTSAVAAGATDAEVKATAEQSASKNLFRIMNAIGQRATIVATSTTIATADPTAAGWATVGGNVLAVGTAGTPAAASFAVTFLVERAAVFSNYGQKAGASVAITVDPAAEVAASLAKAGLFLTSAGAAAGAAAGVTVKVLDSFTPIV